MDTNKNNKGCLSDTAAIFTIITGIMFILGYFGINYQKEQKEKQTVNESISQPTTVETKENTLPYKKEKSREQNTNETQVNPTINQNQTVVNIEPYVLPDGSGSSNQNSNEQQPKIQDCEKNNTGDYCFTNNTNIDIIIGLYDVGNNSYQEWEAKKKAKILIGESACLYEIPNGIMVYKVFGQIIYNNNNWAIATEGEIKVEKCTSKSLSITGTYYSKTKTILR